MDAGWALGHRVVVSLADSSQDLEGYVGACDESLDCLILQTASRSDPGRFDLRVVRMSRVASIRVLGESPRQVPDDAQPRVNWARLRAREEAAVRKLQKEQAHLNSAVTDDVQAIFDALAKTLPCYWDNGTDIVVMDVVRIRDPYGVEDAVSDDQACLARVRMVLEKERDKLRASV